MRDLENFDPTVFAAWPRTAIYDGGGGWGDAACRLAAEGALLETKSGAPQEVLRGLLNDMTDEMRAQFDLFKALRTAAEKLDEQEDETAAKLARADIKAAVDAMSLIVRTLEKIDALQRQIARDRELESERHAEETGYEGAKTRLLAIIEQRVQERVEAILAERARALAAGTGPPDLDLRLSGAAGLSGTDVIDGDTGG